MAFFISSAISLSLNSNAIAILPKVSIRGVFKSFSILNIVNGTYLSSFDSTWASLIVDTNWHVGGVGDSEYYTAKEYYEFEFGDRPSSSTIYNAKIGLMYVSDYGYAATPDNWNTVLGDYHLAADSNWLYYNDYYDLTISPSTNVNSIMIISSYSGSITSARPSTQYPYRPVFYLNSNVLYSSGTGTSSNPIRIVV